MRRRSFLAVLAAALPVAGGAVASIVRPTPAEGFTLAKFERARKAMILAAEKTVNPPLLVRDDGLFHFTFSTEQQVMGWHRCQERIFIDQFLRGRSAVDRVAHTHEAAGSSPAPAPISAASNA